MKKKHPVEGGKCVWGEGIKVGGGGMGGEVRRGELLSSLALPGRPGPRLINRGETSLETRMRALARHSWSVRRRI